MSVPRGTASRLRLLSNLVSDEAGRQNLIARSTMSNFYRRHLADSLQLIPLLKSGSVLDVGSGAGFPGLVIACVRAEPVILVEPRRLRASFLQRCVEAMHLRHVTVHCAQIERVFLPSVMNVTARAVMPLDALFAAASHLTAKSTRWVIPKGRSARSELADARLSWQGRFELVASRTDGDAYIVVGDAVRKRED